MRTLDPDPCPPKTRGDLEWGRLLDALADRCASELGRERARTLPFAATLAEAIAWARENEEARALLDAGTGLPAESLPDPSPMLAQIASGVQLGSRELRDSVTLLEAGRRLRRFLEAHRATSTALFAACPLDPALDDVSSVIAASFDGDGTLSDKASTKLRELRVEHRAQRARIHTKLDQFMSRNEHLLQERFVTERDGCWVIPMKATAASKLKGVVHGESGSGSTVFFEPEAIADLTTKLRTVQGELEREEHVIYTRLSALLCGVSDSVAQCAAAVSRADVRAATAKLARDLRLAFPTLVEEPRLDLRAARHPLLVLALGDVVASDVSLREGTCLVISGPNAGGKTVTLKTIGIAALMARAGLPVACGPGSTIGVFDAILTELGDEQNLSKNLSTFSAHMVNMASVIARSGRGALVLLDELASGTDPHEGEALASGILVALCRRGAAVAVTTHYEGLKSLAFDDAARFCNASVGFDFETMRPTFRLRIGVPGGSSAFAVAERFGIPADVLGLARDFVSAEDTHLEQLVRRLNLERAALDADRAAAAAVAPPPLEVPPPAPPPEPPPPALVLAKGTRVFVTSLKATAEILSVLGAGQVRVLAGKLKITVDVNELRALPTNPPARAPRTAS